MPDWLTRREVRSQKNLPKSEHDLQALLTLFDKRMNRLNERYLRLMGEHIADIGKLWPSDVHRLQQIRRMNKNLRQIETQISKAAGMSADEVEKVFRQIAQEDVRMAAKILGVPDTVRVSNNQPLQRILRGQAQETARSMRNLSNTTVVSDAYKMVVDEAVSAVQSGVDDYGSAIRRVIREAGASGLRVRDNGTKEVQYASGRTRRLDSAVRMNILDGVRHLNQSIMEEVGRQFGANGVEIDAHMLCAEDHMPYQGGQYSNEEFEEIQDSLDRPFGEWNCRHSWHPIMLGISPRTYSSEDLEQMQEYSTELIEIDGKTQTRYQWSQEMRRCETAIRAQKDTAILAEAAGNTSLQRHSQSMVTELLKHYDEVSGKTGIKPEYQRTYVKGFVDAQDNMDGLWQQYSTRYSQGISNTDIPSEGIKQSVSDTLDHIMGDFPLLKEHLQTITYGYDTDGAAAAARSDGKEILLDVRSFKSHDILKKVLSDNVSTGHTAKAEDPMFIVAHECGHCIEDLIAMKRLGITDVNSRENAKNLNTEKTKLWSEYYMHMGFDDESYVDIMKVIKSEVGTYAVVNPGELLANSLGIWYYGTEDHPHVDSLISYVREIMR